MLASYYSTYHVQQFPNSKVFISIVPSFPNKMVVSGNAELSAEDYDRRRELKEFDDTKAGVKGLVDANTQKIPHIFLHPQVEPSSNPGSDHLSVPVVDFSGIEKIPERRKEVIGKLKDACEKWGFCQIVNHEIPVSLIDEMIHGVRSFHEQDAEVKKEYYSRDVTKRFYYNSNFDLYQSKAANWRDTISCIMAPVSPESDELPPVCRDVLFKYSQHVMKLGEILFELLSEALGLEPNYLKGMHCAEGLFILGHYFPSCPQPELTLGTSSHTDSGFLTLLVQDQVGGLQVFHENQWIDVPPLHGAVLVNIADLMQLISNDKFKSLNHRVTAGSVGPRISVASFFRTHFGEETRDRMYGPIKQLITEENPQVYRETVIKEYLSVYYEKGLGGESPLSHFKLQK